MNVLQKPDYLCSDVFTIDYERLLDEGIRVLCFDIENTLGLMHCTDFGIDTRFLIKRLKGMGFKIILATNSTRDFSQLVAELGVDIMQPTPGRFFWQRKQPRKPQAAFFKALIDKAGFPIRPMHMAMIGDKLIADVCAAQDCGLTGILINPLGKDLWIEGVMRLRQREQRSLKLLKINRAT